MADKSALQEAVASSPVITPVKAETVKKAAKAKNPKAKPNHPSTADMVNTAIKTLAERNGSSLQAIKKYIATTYKLDTEKLALFIKKYLKSAVTNGILVQTKGKGASGSFKIAVKKSETTKAKPKAKTTATKKEEALKKAAVKKPAAKKAEAAKAKSKKEAAQKKATVKKPVADKKTAKPKAEAVIKSKSSKAKKATKVPTAKPKAPKSKKASAPKGKAGGRKPATAKK